MVWLGVRVILFALSCHGSTVMFYMLTFSEQSWLDVHAILFALSCSGSNVNFYMLTFSEQKYFFSAIAFF